MRQAGWVAIVLFAVVSTGVAQSGGVQGADDQEARSYFSSRRTANPGKALTGYLKNLESTNNGVVESSIAHIGFMMVVFPELDRSAVLETLEKLSLYAGTPGIRYKAYLASLVAVDPPAFHSILDNEYHDPDEFFVEISRRAQAALLGEAVAH